MKVLRKRQAFCPSLEDRPMTTAFINGLEIIAVMTMMTLVMCPVLLWLLPQR
ncbi:hypothetical protein GFS31_13680 [Leptolyngbya sp. BL0902]|nr:hypothetical protein GFS31_13680 [Leptolyngbya sp. BL0902]